MKTKNILAVLASIALIVSCQKEEVEPVVLKVYEQNSVEPLPVKLLTKGGEITDTNIIKSFVNRHWLYSFYPGINGNTYLINTHVSNPIRIEYIADDKVNFIKDNRRSSRKVIAENGIVYFESKEIIGILDYKETSYYKLTKYKPYWMHSHSINYDSGVREVTDFKHCYFATVSGNDLILPFFAYDIVRDNPNDLYNQIIESGELLNNAFGGVPENYLGDQDTLFVQESRITLKLR